MREFHTLVFGPASAEGATKSIAEHIRARGISAWSECSEEGVPDPASVAWADAVILVDPTPNAFHSRTPIPWQRRPHVLVTSAWLPSAEKAKLIDHGFDHVLSSDCSPLVIAAHVERLVHRGAFSIARLREGTALPGA